MVDTPVFFTEKRKINYLNLQGKILKSFILLDSEKEGFLLHTPNHKAMKINAGQALMREIIEQCINDLEIVCN